MKWNGMEWNEMEYNIKNIGCSILYKIRVGFRSVILFCEDMSSSTSAHRLLLTKEALREYKYNTIIMKFALQIRDTICDDIEKGNISCDKQTKYAYRLDEQNATAYKLAIQIHDKSRVHMELIEQLRQYFPDSKITIVEQERVDGFTVKQNKYIEVDWS